LRAWEQLDDAQRRANSSEFAIALSALGGVDEAGEWTTDKALAWVSDPSWRLRVAVALNRYHNKGPQHSSSLLDLALAAPTTLVPFDPSDQPLHPHTAWNWIISGAGLDYAQQHAPPQRPLWRGLQDPISAASPDPRGLTRQRQGTALRHLGDKPLALSFTEDSTELALFTSDESGLLWRQRWATPAYLPGRSVAWQQGVLIVAAGQSRLHIINPNDGEIIAEHRVANGLAMPSQAHWLDGNDFAILSPIGVNNILTLRIGDTTQTIALPQPAKWAIPFRGKILIADHAGKTRLYPGGKTVAWPGVVPASAPSLTTDGLFAEGNLWQWPNK
jgi:hypothetical protein